MEYSTITETSSNIKHKKRIPFIDLAKGICILFVVAGHSYLLGSHYNPHFLNICSVFRMPLYFLLSGLFFKTYKGFFDFLIRKTNKLLIPFTFWHITLSLILPAIIIWCTYGRFYFHTIQFHACGIWNNRDNFNMAIWFLLALFVTNILFYIIYLLSSIKYIKKFHILSLITLSIICGVISYYLRKYSIKLPLYGGTVLAAMPFFAGGYLIRKYTNILTSAFTWRTIIAMIICIIPFYFIYHKNCYIMDMRTNTFRIDSLLIYICGFAGTFFILFISKLFKYIPLISYMGRYSIIILVTHFPVIRLLRLAYNSMNMHLDRPLRGIIFFIATITICTLLIEPCRRFLPYFTAQKDMIKRD